ncbi:Diphthamide biosynthesis protein 2, variant 2 [Entomophthora muscae]|uniref:Diphthamide biosynthesis protein 2, variant 2 n=1 Tax=Entomophthora muscae TaxID=34485 RepID=A0ACC2UQB5_9FUNG|nr:Diphthamide biosynthesis protein 2, variant 2 [Entomophthora muscae]
MNPSDTHKEDIVLSGPTGFYGDAAELLSRGLEVPQSTSAQVNVHNCPDDALKTGSDKFSACELRFDLVRVSQNIIKAGCCKIALQFPDHLLHVSDVVCQCLTTLCPSAEFFILADTSYGSCCNDAVAASHADADCLVHFGHSCLSMIQDLPVIYSFDKLALDVKECASKVAGLSLNDSTLLIVGEVGYSHCLALLQEELASSLSCIQVVTGLLPNTQNIDSTMLDLSVLEGERAEGRLNKVCGRYFPSNHNPPTTILYVGGETIELTNLLMTKDSSSKIYRFDPSTGKAFEDGQTINRRLMRRYHLVQKARDASVFGIVVGTLGVTNYLPMIQHVRDLVETNGGKAYTFVMGKLNVAKLANFPEIDMYVLIACPENSLIDSKEFFRPIITPYELGLALNPDSQWTGQYVTEFETVLNAAPVAAQEEDVPHYSLVTGKLVNPRRYRHTSTVELELEAEGSLLKRDQPSDVAQAMGSAAGKLKLITLLKIRQIPCLTLFSRAGAKHWARRSSPGGKRPRRYCPWIQKRKAIIATLYNFTLLYITIDLIID